MRGLPDGDGSSLDRLSREELQARYRELAEAYEHQLRILHAIGVSSPDFTYLFDRDHRFLYVSPALLKLWGLTMEQAYGKNFEQLGYPPHLVELHRRQLDEALTGKTVAGGNAFTDRNGNTGHYRYTFVPVRGADGRVETIVGTTQDVTARVRAEQENATILEKLTESEAQFRHFADAMPQLAWIAQADGYISWYNDGWYRYTGTTAEQMAGWGWQMVHKPAELPRVMERWKASIETGQPFEMTFPLRGADGNFRSFLTRVTPVRDSQGRITRWFGTNTDIEDQIRAIKMREDFLSIASHELKTPITSLRLNLQLGRKLVDADQGLLAPPARLARNLEQALKASSRLADLVEELLDVSRLGAGRLSYRFETLDAAALIRELAERHADDLARAGCAFTVIADREAKLDGDRFRLEQVVSNLLTNAAKYAPGTRVEVSVAQAGDRVRIAVSDGGPGIPREQHQRIFERFERGIASSNAGGLGLGLYISREIVRAHGGTIAVESEPGAGARFVVELPLRQLA